MYKIVLNYCIFLFISSFNFISIPNKLHRYLQSLIVVQRGFVQLYWQNIKVLLIQNIRIYKVFILCCRSTMHMLPLGFPKQNFVCISYLSSVPKRQYSPSITATFISVYCLLHVLAFVQSHYQTIKLHKATQQQYNPLDWYFFR